MIVLDASALLALLFREEGSEQVVDRLHSSLMSTVNLSEVLGRFARDGHDPVPVLNRLTASPIEFVAFGVAESSEAASLLHLTSEFGLSLGDRACLSLARLRGLPALTADRVWAGLSIDVDIQLIR